ncbi:ABC transporter ATP-binding protein [Methylobacterium dankookense]|uniref:Fe(3+) dicitrate transport ATP-binding protein FecE n=1 Tax=Methylobacterium dankookense TaxID=560405 RepID=A0A564G192_9HYPH|nr:ABC transporter ATP-binding protein [Methylobacterium dankookense]GJD58437.1 Fe(3+) dicitrate transport ATP-binding protein FecE [Methylobacterium dankookense]VUF13922.1 Fe(3+) dicitrate transport ATP-binding protein FecE [Methylobacterium dankookense]
MSRLRADSLTVMAGTRRLLDAVSVDLAPGALVGLIGPNGAGKSTLLRCLAGLLRPGGGAVTLDGAPLADLPSRERGRRIGYLPQSFQPAWDYTVGEVVALGASRRPGATLRIPDLLRDHELTGLGERRWSQVSGGERARALLAATLVAEPDVLLADEPGASLDIGHRIDLMRRLRDWSRRSIVVVVLHDIERAALDCDRLLLLEEGRIVRDGAAATVAGSPDLDRVFGIRFERGSLAGGADAVLMLERRP